MQNLKQASKFERFSAVFSLLIVMALLFSCSKNAANLPKEDNAQVTTAGPSSHASTRTSIVAVPFETNLFVPCANNGSGEDVILSGKRNFVYQIEWDENGFTLVYHDNIHQGTGTGLSSGDTFSVSGVTNGTVRGSWVSNQWSGSMVQQLTVVGNNTVFKVNYKLQLVVTPDGKVSVDTREETVDCN